MQPYFSQGLRFPRFLNPSGQNTGVYCLTANKGTEREAVLKQFEYIYQHLYQAETEEWTWEGLGVMGVSWCPPKRGDPERLPKAGAKATSCAPQFYPIQLSLKQNWVLGLMAQDSLPGSWTRLVGSCTGHGPLQKGTLGLDPTSPDIHHPLGAPSLCLQQCHQAITSGNAPHLVFMLEN